MNSNKDDKKLLPPVGTVLFFAADGLAVINKNLSRSGRPRLPERSVWVVELWLAVHSPQGVWSLKPLIEAGLRGWDFPLPYPRFVDDILESRNFTGRVIETLTELAKTAREPVALPEPPTHPPAANNRPQPEPKAPHPSPSRPRPKKGGPRFIPQ